MAAVRFPGVPFPLTSEGRPSGHEPRALSNGVELTAAPRADLFLDPGGFDIAPDAERFVAPVSGDFQLSALVSVNFHSTFDSGVLIGYVDESTWFKICAELDPAGVPRVVSVVTRGGASDDSCLLYTSDAADDLLCVDLGGRRIIKKNKKKKKKKTTKK